MAETWDHLEDWEEWDPSKGSFYVHAAAGSLAGAAEHILIFPLDTIKTIQQVQGSESIPLRSIVREPTRLWRGVSTMLTACIPAHAAYFSIYEKSKVTLGANSDHHTPLASGACGVFATLAHDAWMTPFDVCKQRMQLGFHSSMIECVQTIMKTEGLRAFYLSYPTTLIMNVPYAAVMVASNESIKKIINPGNEYNLPAFFLSGGLAGSIAAGITTPLDVVKTRLQTQSILEAHKTNPDHQVASVRNFAGRRTGASASGVAAALARRTRAGLFPPSPISLGLSVHYTRCRYKYSGMGPVPDMFGSRSRPTNTTYNTSSANGTTTKSIESNPGNTRRFSTNASMSALRYRGLLSAIRTIHAEEGLAGFFKGLKPRLAVHAPSVAISWGTYETCKNLFIRSDLFP